MKGKFFFFLISSSHFDISSPFFWDILVSVIFLFLFCCWINSRMYPSNFDTCHNHSVCWITASKHRIASILIIDDYKDIFVKFSCCFQMKIWSRITLYNKFLSKPKGDIKNFSIHRLLFPWMIWTNWKKMSKSCHPRMIMISY